MSKFNILIIAQSGRLEAEAALFVASLRHKDPDFSGQIFVAEPQPGPNWGGDPRVSNETKAIFERLDARILPLHNEVFGANYKHGNKIEALSLLPKGEPFVFFDSDTLVTAPLSAVPFDFDRPSASDKVTGTWPKPTLYGPGTDDIWKSLYDRFGLDFESSLDLSQPKDFWRRYLYFNAGWFYFRCPKEFGAMFLDMASAIFEDPPAALIGQSLDPWLDQIALPLVIHALGGGKEVLPKGLLDGEVTCHYRALPLLYAREADTVVEILEAVAAPNWLKKVLKLHDPFKRMIYQGKGDKVRQMFDRSRLPTTERVLRQQIKKQGLWLR